jgi:hypothetical protein
MNDRHYNSLLFHNTHEPMSLGCTVCPDKHICGGLQASDGLYDCMDFCKCDDPLNCQYVCHKDTRLFIRRAKEVRGFDFNNIPRLHQLEHSALPVVVPLLFHPSARSNPLKVKAVAIKLSSLFNHKTGELKYKSKEALAKHYLFDENAQLIIIGVDKDQPIEDYWENARAANIVRNILPLKPDLVSTPNYSIFLNAPRWDNLHNMKRIAICWSELVSAGIPSSIHINARTDYDWQRWIELVAEREEIQSISIEFATGTAILDRGRWHTEKLILLAESVHRNLHLVMRGGYRHLEELHRAFSSLTFIDTSSFMRTVNRRRLIWGAGQIGKWHKDSTLLSEPLDNLLQHNVDTVAARITYNLRKKFCPSQ